MKLIKKLIKNIRENASTEKKFVDIEDDSLVGHLDSYDGENLRGWAANLDSAESCSVSIFVNDEFNTKVEANQYRADLTGVGPRGGYVSFDHNLPVRPLIQKYGYGFSIHIFFGTKKKQLIGSPIVIREPNLLWEINTLNCNEIEGWVYDRNNPVAQHELKIWINGNNVASLIANEECPELKGKKSGNIFHGFKINLTEFEFENGWLELDLTVELEEIYRILDKVKVFSTLKSVLALEKLHNVIRESNIVQSDELQLLKDFIPASIQAIRENRLILLNSYQRSESDEAQESNLISVVIPIYRGVTVTKECIDSVLESKNQTNFQLVLINDKSPEKEMAAILAEYTQRENVRLLTHSKNQGFVASANRGMNYFEESDVVLLNSDTRVGDGWLDALKTAAYEEKMIGTVTPLSNNASIFSFPDMHSSSEYVDTDKFKEIVEACKHSHAKNVEVPTAHGFCMFIKRSLINEIGVFDENLWGRGYGEENDFSLKASALGWKNVATNKTYVMHYGSVSFASESRTRQNENIKTLNEIYPEYNRRVSDFFKTDPLRSQKLELFERVLLNNSYSNLSFQTILFINHSVGGGTHHAANNIAARLVDDGTDVVILSPNGRYKWRLHYQRLSIFGEYEIPSEFERLVGTLKELKIFHVHFHHTLQFSEEVWTLPRVLDCAYDVSIHDFFFICPRITLSNKEGVYCGEPGVRSCDLCLEKNGVDRNIFMDEKIKSIQEWRDKSKSYLIPARQVFAPSKYVYQKMEKYFSLKNLALRAHLEGEEIIKVERKEKTSHLHIGILGAISEIKGLNVIKALAAYVANEKLSAKIYIIGYTADNEFFSKYDFVSITGAYARDALVREVSKCDIDVFFISSTVPETHCFVYSEIVQMNYPVLAFDLGAVAERIKESGYGRVINVNARTQDVYKALELSAHDNYGSTKIFLNQYKGRILDSYYDLNSIQN